MLRAFAGDWDGLPESVPELSAAEWRHLAGVRRARDGEPVEVLNGRGAVAHCRIRKGAGRQTRFVVETVERREKPGECWLRVAPPKGKDFAAVLQKAVELGATRITPLVTENGSVPEKRLREKGERLQAVLVEAVKQSGNPLLPELEEPRTLQAVLAEKPDAKVRLCGALTADSEPLARCVEGMDTRAVVELFVGPEGDFSVREYELLRGAGCRMASLGPLVLRVETAVSLLLGTVLLRRFA